MPGRQIRRIGLDQDAVGRQFGRDLPQPVEALNVRMPVKEMNRPSAMARRASSRPPVKQCSTAGKAPFPISSSRMRARVVVGLAGMDDERQSGLARGGDMGAKAPLLRFARRIVVMIVEAGLAERDDLGRARARDEIGRGDVRLLMRVMRMGADRAIDVGKAFRDRQQLGLPLTRVEIVTMRSMPAARARPTTASSSAAKSGKSRWQWLSISIFGFLTGYCALAFSGST